MNGSISHVPWPGAVMQLGRGNNSDLHSASALLCQSIGRSVGRSVSRSVSWSVGWSVGWSVAQLVISWLVL